MADPFFTVPDFGPSDLLTSDKIGARRVQVDVGSTGFSLGQEYRFFFELDIPVGESRWVRVTAPINFILRAQNAAVDDGALRFRAWRDATDVGPWAAPASPTSGWFNRNSVAQDKFGYVGQIVVEIGGDGAALEDGTVSEIARIKSAGSTAHQATVSGSAGGERGVPAGTYYLQLENTGTGSLTGVYGFIIEERTAI